jgi:hypothetical protein
LLQVANPGRYNFDRQALLLGMVQLATQLGKHAEFLQVRSRKRFYKRLWCLCGIMFVAWW